MVPVMSKGFRPGDVRRTQAAFDEMMPDGYVAEVKMAPDRKFMLVVVMDPEDVTVYVANCSFTYDEKPLKGSNGIAQQPPDLEVMRIASEFGKICQQYPASKAKQDAEQLFKTDFADRKQKARDDEELAIAAQEKADEDAQRARDNLLAKADADEKAAEEAEARP